MQANRSANSSDCYAVSADSVAAVTKPGDLVVDPAAGSFVVLRAAMTLGRRFVGVDITHQGEDQIAG
jgi:DNA methylase